MTAKSFYCFLCDESIEHEAPDDNVYDGIAAAAEHFRVLHPDVYAEMQRWPDGSPVVIDETLSAEDFTEETDD